MGYKNHLLKDILDYIQGICLGCKINKHYDIVLGLMGLELDV
jgi:hypothetical protein